MSKQAAIIVTLLLFGCSDAPSKNNTNNTNNGNNTNNVNNTNNANNTNNQNNTNNENNQPGPPEIDILMVVDNSGSMCQQQHVLTDQAAEFFNQLADTDFHLGVTTTHMNEDYPPETVAVPGHLQNRIQPIVGFDQSCIQTVDENGNIVDGDYRPVVRAIDIAVDCMLTPDESLRNPSAEDLTCAITGQPANCEIANRCGAGECGIADLFPDPAQIKTLPTVLKAQDYQEANGQLDVTSLVRDFRCLAYAGVRGYGFEKGLSAASLAVSPELTGGAVESPTDADAPNHGLIRENARFGLVFLTDENDCSHDGSIDEGNPCGDAVCSYAEVTGESLIPVESLSDELLTNLSETKGTSMSKGDVFVGSIHGDPIPFDGVPLDSCEPGQDRGIEPVCRNELGRSFSGSRYDAYLRTFSEGNVFPRSDDGVQGWTCTGNFAPALSQIGELFASQTFF